MSKWSAKANILQYNWILSMSTSFSHNYWLPLKQIVNTSIFNQKQGRIFYENILPCLL